MRFLEHLNIKQDSISKDRYTNIFGDSASDLQLQAMVSQTAIVSLQLCTSSCTIMSNFGDSESAVGGTGHKTGDAVLSPQIQQDSASPFLQGAQATLLTEQPNHRQQIWQQMTNL